MPLLDWILAGGLTLGSHELGHEFEADRQNVPISWDGAQWRTPTNDKRKLARIAGAGFEGQDILSRISGDPKKILAASALEKLRYSLYPQGISGDGSDVRTIGQAKGKDAERVARGVLAISALSDIHRMLNPNRKWDVGYWQSDMGTPGIKLSVRF